MEIRENFSLKSKTTMRIGGLARYFSELKTKEDVEEAVRFASERNIPLIPLGGGSNTIFADGTIEALVVQVKYEKVEETPYGSTSFNVSPGQAFLPGAANGQTGMSGLAAAGGDQSFRRVAVKVGAGKNLPMLINELATKGLDLSPLTGILGTIGGAVFGNAGQGPKGIWIDSFVESVEAFVEGEWKKFTKEECKFRYRESGFKDVGSSPTPACPAGRPGPSPGGRGGKPKGRSIIWEATLAVPEDKPSTIKANIEALLKKRIETQPHVKTAGSCFKAVGETPAWQLIDSAGLRGFKVGGVEIAQKHANFLLNVGEATFSDAVAVVERVKQALPENLEVEMRFYLENGDLHF